MASRPRAEAEPQKVTRLRPNIFLLPGGRPSSHSYVIRGANKQVLLDPGTYSGYPSLVEKLKQAGLGPRDIDLVILTHEHFDHIGAASFFLDTALVAAHRLGANKIELQDEFVITYTQRDTSVRRFSPHIWLERETVLDLGDFRLHTLHTPGHTSGCICLYEPFQKVLFAGDTVFAGGTISDMAPSGNISDYVDSLRRLSTLQLEEIYPGHGRISTTPQKDLTQALQHALGLFEDTKHIYEAISRRRSSPPQP